MADSKLPAIQRFADAASDVSAPAEACTASSTVRFDQLLFLRALLHDEARHEWAARRRDTPRTAEAQPGPARAGDDVISAIVARALLAQGGGSAQLSRLVGELGESLQVSEQTRAGQWSIRLQLKQEILPSTELLMASDGYCISARFTTTDAQVERLLNTERDELARALSRQNRLRIQIEVERVERLP